MVSHCSLPLHILFLLLLSFFFLSFFCLQCHPGYPSQTGDDFSRSIDREWELDILCDSSWMNFARNTHTHFVSFSQLENLVDEKKNITETTNTILS